MAIDAGSIYSAVRVRLDKLKGDVKSVETLLDQIGASSEKNAQQTQDSFESAFDATKLAGVAAFAAITLAIKQSIKVAGDYEQSIANVQSVVMGSAEVFDALNETAKRAGETTRFTASQAADALYNLAQGGLTAKESIDALDGVLMLAGATQSGLAESSALMVATLNQYSLEANQASRISNVFAASISSSMATMDKLTSGMRQAGPIASALGLSLEETVSALNAMFDAGYQGEQAGTALRSMLAFLASETDPTVRKLMDLGLTFEQINPAANSFADVIDNIAKSGADAGEIMDAFGIRAGAQMLTLLRNGKEGLKEYEGAITDTETATEMYIIQNETLQGSLYRLKSAAQSAQIEFVEEFTPVMRTFLELLTKITIHVAGLPGPLKIFFGVLLAGVPTVLALTKAFTALSAAMAGAAGPIGWVVAGVAAVTAGISALAPKLKELDAKKTEKEFGDLAEEFGITAEEMKKLQRQADNTNLSVQDYFDLVHVLNLSTTAANQLSQIMNRLELIFRDGEIFDYFDSWAEGLGITAEQMAKILLASNAIRDADREVLEGIVATAEAERALAEEQANRAKTEEEHMLELKRDLVKSRNEQIRGMQAEGEEQQKLFDIYDATLAEIDRKQQLGVVTEKEALEEKKKASDALIKALLAQETRWTNNNQAIRDAVATGKEYAAGVKEIEDAEKADKEAAEARLAALEELAEEQQRAQEQLEELGATEREMVEIQRQRRLATIDASIADEEAKQAATEAVNAYYDSYIDLLDSQKQLAADTSVKQAIEEQRRLLEELGKTQIELLNIRREREKEEARASGAEQTLIDQRIAQIDEYYDALVAEENHRTLLKQEEERAREMERQAIEAQRLQEAQEKMSLSYRQRLEEIGKEELELIEIRRNRAIESARAAGGEQEAIEATIDSINAYHDALADETKAEIARQLHEEEIARLEREAAERQRLADQQEKEAISYRQRTEDIGKSELELLDIQRRRAIEGAKGNEDLIKSIDDYYDALVDQSKAETARKLHDEEIARLDREAKERQRVIDQQEKETISYQQRAEDIGKSEMELIELQRERALRGIENNEALTNSINEYYDALADQSRAKEAAEAERERQRLAEEQQALDDVQIASAEDYREKLEDLHATEKELIELQRRRAIAAAEASGASADAIALNVEAINEYYDALRDTEPEKDAVEKTKKMASEIKGIWDGLSSSIASLFSALYADRLDNLERELDAELQAAGLADKTAKEKAEQALKESRERNEEEISLIEARLAAALDAGDEQSAILLRQQMEEAQAAHEEVEREKQKAIEKAQIEEEYAERRKQLQFEAAMVSWRIQMAQAVADAAMLALSGFLTKPFIPAGLAAGALATAQGAIQIAAVTAAKPKLATGGIVLPRAGGTDVTLAENAYPELALNAGPSGQELMAMFAQQIVDHMPGPGGGTIIVNLQVDRKTLSTIVVDDINNGRVRLNR